MQRFYKTFVLFSLLIMAFLRPAAAEAQAYGTEQLDQLIAPIALYPDDLLGQILMASTYPLEIVEAERWRRDNPGISDGALTDALEQMDWDPSVKSLTQTPEVLAMMDNNLEWTEKLGEAFLADQGSVMDSVQRLRARAADAGRLQSTPQLSVTSNDGIIGIAPAQPDTVYVPYYNPTVVFAPWPYPSYAPYYFRPPYYSNSYGTTWYFFGPPIVVINWLWHWDHCDWRHHRIHVDDDDWRRLNHDRPPPMRGVWTHDPAHRRDVPYTNPVVRRRFQPLSPTLRQENRGYRVPAPTTPQILQPRVSQPSVSKPSWQQKAGGFAPTQQPHDRRQDRRNTFGHPPEVTTPVAPGVPAVEAPAAPTAPSPTQGDNLNNLNRVDAGTGFARNRGGDGYERRHHGRGEPVSSPIQQLQQVHPVRQAPQPIPQVQAAAPRAPAIFESFGSGRDVRRERAQGRYAHERNMNRGPSLPHGAVPMPAVRTPAAPRVTSPSVPAATTPPSGSGGANHK